MLKAYFLYAAGLFLLAGFISPASAQITNKPVNKTQVDTVAFANIRAVPSAYAGGTRVNYIRTRDAMGRITFNTAFNNAGYLYVKEATQYMDGLGRPLQQVSRQITPNAKDLVAPVIYDELGREPYKYLAYAQTSGTHATDGKFKPNPFADQATFYQDNTLNPGCKGEQAFYAMNVFESSPLNRTIRACAPGNSWAGANSTTNLFTAKGRGVSQEFLVNNNNYDSVRIWKTGYDTLTYTAADTTANIPTTAGIYGSGQLYKTITSDENCNKSYEYKDAQGKIILKKIVVDGYNPGSFSDGLCTYYVYDDFNRLRFVIPPKAVSWLYKNSWNFSAAGGRSQVVEELCFRYEYDERGRMIAKKVPGKGWEYMVYDIRDRLVYSQDANLRSKNQWLATLYDEINRPVTTGIIKYTSNRSTLQIAVGGQTNPSPATTVRLPTSLTRTNIFINLPVGNISIIARRTITLKPGFVTIPRTNVHLAIGNVPEKVDSAIVSNNPLVPAAVPADSLIVLTNTYYDDYSWSPAVTYNESYRNKLDSGTNLNFETLPTLAEQQKTFTKGLITINRVRVIEDPDSIGNGDFLTTTNFYDNRGRLLQVQSDNYKTGKDTVTNRYDFTGNIICSYVAHNNPAAGMQGKVRIKTNMDYDHAGRLLKTWKTINDNADGKVLMANHQYDETGQLKKKELGQIKQSNGFYSTDPIETLDYTYNIRGWLQGINKDGTDISGFNPNRWFGMTLNYDWGFDSVQYNGNISGTIWRTKGNTDKRAYGFSYDRANRLMDACYSFYITSLAGFYVFNDYSVQMGDGINAAAAYDENGNINRMKQWAKTPTSNIVMDDMTYNYSGNSNKLLNVIDTGVDRQLSDFHTSKLHPYYNNKTSTTVDYTYDGNGNLLKDLNKDIGTSSVSGIQYNHLNLPYKITVYDSAGVKGTITYIYDATGNKLEKRITENNQPAKKSTYINAFVYENDKLQFLGDEEGRTRYAKKYFVNGDSAYLFMHDYFVKDHLGNTRLVLTEQKDTAKYIATMETAYRAKEDALFSNVSLTAYSSSLVPGGYPVDTTVTNPNNYVSRLNGSGNKIGPALTLKVMAGDTIDIATKSFYRPNSSPGGNVDIISAIAYSIYQGILPVTGTSKGFLGNPSDFGTPLQQIIHSTMLPFRSDHNPTISGRPKAFLNWILFNEDFIYQSNGSGAIHVGNADELTTLAQSNIAMPVNGYLYIYVSNETQNWDVFFDNLAVNHRTGPLLEETHYYPFGMTMAGISSKAMGKLENRFKFNNGTELENKEFSDGSGLDLYATEFRGYDPQIGRFWQIDELADLYHDLSPYVFANNNPILLNDPFGLASDTTVLPTVTVTPSGPGPLAPVCYTCTTPKPDPSSAAGANPLPAVPIPPLGPAPPPGKVIPLNPNVDIPIGPAIGRILGTAGLVLIPLPAGQGSALSPFYYGHLGPQQYPNTYPGHGNDKDNWNPHYVYRFTFTPNDNKTPVLKYGISDYARNHWKRVTRQYRKFVRLYGSSVKLTVLIAGIPRIEALGFEKDLVTSHVKQWHDKPREQDKPDPDPF